VPERLVPGTERIPALLAAVVVAPPGLGSALMHLCSPVYRISIADVSTIYRKRIVGNPGRFGSPAGHGGLPWAA
jgi:hypothetical protein